MIPRMLIEGGNYEDGINVDQSGNYTRMWTEGGNYEDGIKGEANSEVITRQTRIMILRGGMTDTQRGCSFGRDFLPCPVDQACTQLSPTGLVAHPVGGRAMASMQPSGRGS